MKKALNACVEIAEYLNGNGPLEKTGGKYDFISAVHRKSSNSTNCEGGTIYSTIDDLSGLVRLLPRKTT